MVVITKAQEIAPFCCLEWRLRHIVNYPPRTTKELVALQMHKPRRDSS